MIEYLLDNKHYMLSYQDLKEHYNKYILLSNEEFIKELHNVLHVSCIIAYLKEIPSEHLVSDEGIIHQLVHLLCIKDDPIIDIDEIRELFKEKMKLD